MLRNPRRLRTVILPFATNVKISITGHGSKATLETDGFSYQQVGKEKGKVEKGERGETGIICIQGQGWDKGPESYKPSTRNPIMLYHREELGQGLKVGTNLLPTPTPLHPSRLQLHPFKKAKIYHCWLAADSLLPLFD